MEEREVEEEEGQGERRKEGGREAEAGNSRAFSGGLTCTLVPSLALEPACT